MAVSFNLALQILSTWPPCLVRQHLNASSSCQHTEWASLDSSIPPSSRRMRYQLVKPLAITDSGISDLPSNGPRKTCIYSEEMRTILPYPDILLVIQSVADHITISMLIFFNLIRCLLRLLPISLRSTTPRGQGHHQTSLHMVQWMRSSAKGSLRGTDPIQSTPLGPEHPFIPLTNREAVPSSLHPPEDRRIGGY